MARQPIVVWLMDIDEEKKTMTVKTKFLPDGSLREELIDSETGKIYGSFLPPAQEWPEIPVPDDTASIQFRDPETEITVAFPPGLDKFWVYNKRSAVEDGVAPEIALKIKLPEGEYAAVSEDPDTPSDAADYTGQMVQFAVEGPENEGDYAFGLVLKYHVPGDSQQDPGNQE
jgi:hypothetical protein